MYSNGIYKICYEKIKNDVYDTGDRCFISYFESAMYGYLAEGVLVQLVMPSNGNKKPIVHDFYNLDAERLFEKFKF